MIKLVEIFAAHEAYETGGVIDEELEQLKQSFEFVGVSDIAIHERDADPVEEAEFLAALQALSDDCYGSCDFNWLVEGF